MNPRRLRLAVGVVALSFVLAIALGAGGLFGSGPALGAATTITIISGDVQVRHGASGTFVAATDGEIMAADDTIRTGPDARAVLTYFEASTVTIEPNSELAIKNASVKTDGSTVIVMQQTVGRTWHVVTKLVTGNSKYEVDTPASTASVRGTAFTVDITFEDNQPVASITTTEGTVVHSAPDPQQPTQEVQVPVTAGSTEKIKKGETPAPAAPAPEPDKKVTVQVSAGNGLVTDQFGRTNGITPDGKVVLQTPGAQVKKDGANISVILPNLPDGKIATRVDTKKDTEVQDVSVTTTVEVRGSAPVKIEEKVTPADDKKATAGIELLSNTTGKVDVRKLDASEKKELKEVKVGEPPKPAGQQSTDNKDKSDKDKGSKGAEPPGGPGQGVPPIGGGQPAGGQPAQGGAPRVEPPKQEDSPTAGQTQNDQPKNEAPKAEPPRAEPPVAAPPVAAPPQQGDAPKVEPPKSGDAPKAEPPKSGGDNKPATPPQGIVPPVQLPQLPGTPPQQPQPQPKPEQKPEQKQPEQKQPEQKPQQQHDGDGTRQRGSG